MAQVEFGPCPPRFADIKREIAASYPDFEERVKRAWDDVLNELEKVTKDIAEQGSEVCTPLLLYNSHDDVVVFVLAECPDCRVRGLG